MFKELENELPKIGQHVVICTIDPKGYTGNIGYNKKENLKFEVKYWDHHDDAQQRYRLDNPNDPWIGPELRMWCPAENILMKLAEMAIERTAKEAKYIISNIEKKHSMGGCEK